MNSYTMSVKDYRAQLKSGKLDVNKKTGRLKKGEMTKEWEAHLEDKFKMSQPSKDTYTIISPINVRIQKNKKETMNVALNLNVYRNLHYQLNNRAKIEYKRLMADQIHALPKFKKVRLEFILHKNSKRNLDRHNVCSIVQKFACDALVELGKLIDDNDLFIESEEYSTGENVKGIPFCTINIIKI